MSQYLWASELDQFGTGLVNYVVCISQVDGVCLAKQKTNRQSPKQKTNRQRPKQKTNRQRPKQKTNRQNPKQKTNRQRPKQKTNRQRPKQKNSRQSPKQQPWVTPSSTSTTARKKKTSAQACRDYKLQLKADALKHEEYKEKARLYSQERTRDATWEMKAKQNEQARLRMQAKRARDRAQEFPAKCTRKTDDERVKMESGEEETRASLNSNTKKMALFERKSWQKKRRYNFK